MTQFICSKKFTDLNIKFPYECVKNCCKSDDTKIAIEEITNLDFFVDNKEYMRRKHSMLFENKLPEIGCKTCVKTEPNSLFRSWNEWKNNLSNNEKEKLYKKDSFNTYEFVLSSACDLKCVYCAPKDSSSWAKELGLPVNNCSSEWEEKILNLLYDHLRYKKYDKDMYHFFFSGGEPTYNPKTILMIEKILEYVPLNKSKIIISTNANTKTSVFEKYISLIQNKKDVKWIFDCSLDSIGERCEAIRYGLNWERSIKNINLLLDIDNVEVRISPTLNLYSIADLEEFLLFFINLYKEKNKFNPYIFNFNMVQEQELTPMVMPKKYQSLLDSSIQICKENNLFFVEHLINVQQLIGTKIYKDSADKIESKFNYFKNKRPDKDWDKLFPHIGVLINELRNN